MRSRTLCRRAAALLAVTAAACLRGEGLKLPREASRVPDDQVVTLLKETRSGVDARRRGVIRSEAEWADFWSLVYARQSPVPDRPEVDFAESMVVLASSGTRPNGGYSIDFEAVGRAGSAYHVVVRESSLARGCVTPAALSNPVIAVRVARAEGRVAFIDKAVTLRC